VSTCKNNPLAIRLTIDSFLAGSDISTSLERTSEEVTSFSFSNLLDALPENANRVLEGLFVIDSPTRTELCDALELDLDQISAAVGDLVRTSLIIRIDTPLGEAYSLGDSIRELLRTNPRNRKVRTQTLEWIQKTRASASDALKRQAEKKVSALDIAFVPQGTNASHVPFARQIQLAAQKSDLRALSQLEIKIRGLLEASPSSAFLHRQYGKILVELDDLQGAEEHFRQSIKTDSKDPAPKLALAFLLHKMQNLDEARDLCKELIESGWGEEKNAGVEWSKRVWFLYLTVLNFREDLDDVFTLTQDWQEQHLPPSVFGVARASAYRRLADKQFRSGTCDVERVGKLICSAVSEIDKVLNIEGPLRSVLAELKKLINELEYYVIKKRLTFSASSNKVISVFITNHKSDIRRACECDLAALLGRFADRDQPCSLSTSKQQSGKIFPTKEDLMSKGYTIVTVKYLPKSDGFPSYVFADDENSGTYYLHVDAFDEGWREWAFVEKGTQLAITHQSNNTGSARKATEIRRVGL